MKKLKMFLFICLLIVSGWNDVLAQNETGLPILAGQNATDPNKGNLSGKITIEGLDPSQPKPIIYISAIFNGVVFDRRQAFENGSYLIPGIPRENVTVIVEVNGIEAGRQSIQPSIMGSIKMDFTLNLLQNSNQKSGVISALYSRSKENEKLFEKATAAAKEKKTDTAIKIFKQIVESDAKDFIAWTEIGTLYFRNEKLSEAENAYNKALELKPDFMPALINLGRVYLMGKQSEKAIPILTKAVETEPASADAQHYLGIAYLNIKKGSKAVIYLYEALRLSPIEKAEIHLNLAWLYNAVGLKEKAVEEYRQFLEKVPKHPDKEKMEKYIKENSPN